MFITGKDIDVLCHQLNEDLRNVQEWLQCSKLFLNVFRTHYMVFTPRKRVIDEIYVKKIRMFKYSVFMLFSFLWVQIESQLTWKIHIEYTCKKLSKCVGMLCKARKDYINIPSSAYTILLNTLILSIATMYGETFPSCLERISLIQKKLIRIITCSPFRAHRKPLYFANKIMNACDINDIGTFMYESIYGNIPDTLRSYFQRNAGVLDHNFRSAND